MEGGSCVIHVEYWAPKGSPPYGPSFEGKVALLTVPGGREVPTHKVVRFYDVGSRCLFMYSCWAKQLGALEAWRFGKPGCGRADGENVRGLAWQASGPGQGAARRSAEQGFFC